MLYELYEYAERLRKSNPTAMAADGFERRDFSFLIHIDEGGNFLELLDKRKPGSSPKAYKGTEYEVPRSRPRTSDAYKKCNFLWDHFGFVLGISEKDKDNDDKQKYFDSWLNFLNNLPSDLKQDAGIKAILKFYEKGQIEKLKQDPNWKDFVAKQCDTMFWLKGDLHPVPYRPKVKEYYIQKLRLEDNTVSDTEDGVSDSTTPKGFCCITGQRGILEKIHSDTPITSSNGPNAPKKLLSFQEDSGYDSYGKTQGYNAPVIKSTSRKFTDAINHLIKNSQQHVYFGESIVLFWAAKNEEFIKLLKETLVGAPVPEAIISQYDDPTQQTEQVKETLLSVFSGTFQKFVDDDSLFHVLTLAPGGGSRICVKYWKKDPISKIAQNIVRHLQDVSLIPPQKNWKSLPLKAFLAASTKPVRKSNAREDKNNSKKIEYRGNFYEVTADLCSDLLKATLENYEYPKRLLQQVVLRCKMDSFRKRQKDDSKDSKQKNHTIFYEQVSIIKACINRSLDKGRSLQGISEKLKMSLDKNNEDQSYLLGRLFAVLERIQWLAHKKEPEENHSSRDGSVNSNKDSREESLNSTLRERFYASASTTPAVVFPRLFCLKEYYFAKLRKDKNKRKGLHWDKTIGEIMDKMPPSFPKSLTLEQQGVFAVGYYHQKYQPKKPFKGNKTVNEKNDK